MQKRFEELDLLRGLAIVGMVVYHLLFILNFFGVYGVDLDFPLMQIFANLVRFDFLALVGVGMVISYYRVLSRGFGKMRAIFQQWKRGAMVVGGALVITGATYLYIPENFIWFGILHLIAVSILFWSLFVEWKWIVLVLSLISFWIGDWVDFPVMVDVQSVDYFPVFPWIGLVGIGVFLGHIFYPNGVRRGASSRSIASPDENSMRRRSLATQLFVWLKNAVCFLGRHSLAIYMIHVPLIMAVLWMMGLVSV